MGVPREDFSEQSFTSASPENDFLLGLPRAL
jgi:hypothetical protein